MRYGATIQKKMGNGKPPARLELNRQAPATNRIPLHFSGSTHDRDRLTAGDHVLNLPGSNGHHFRKSLLAVDRIVKAQNCQFRR